MLNWNEKEESTYETMNKNKKSRNFYKYIYT